MNYHDEQRRKRVTEILKVLSLNPEHIRRVSSIEHNNSTDAPFHNNQHLFTVAINVYELAQYYVLNLSETRTLFIAALYHDVNHSQGKYYDGVNIARAIEAMLTSLSDLEENFTQAEINMTAKLILATEYPHANTLLTTAEKIIRDSDLMQNTEPDYERWMMGLSEETNTVVNFETTKAFFKTTDIYTHIARKKLVNIGLLDKEW